MGVLDEKVAIVTGSARGIGRATAELLWSTARRWSSTTSTGISRRRPAGEIGGETAVHAGDLTKDGEPEKLVGTAIDAWGKLDIIVNNAGYTLDAPIHKMSDDWFQRMLDIHLVAPVPRHPRRRAAPARAGQGASATRAARCSARSSTSPRSRARWATPGRRTTPRARPASSA